MVGNGQGDMGQVGVAREGSPSPLPELGVTARPQPQGGYGGVSIYLAEWCGMPPLGLMELKPDQEF